MFWQLLVVAAAIGAAYYRWSRRRIYKLAAELPCMPNCYPILGNAAMFIGTNEAKILDSLLDRILTKHLSFHDAQFGFRPGLSTEAAVLCLKHTVQYYTSRKTPVFVCFLDLSKAFDLVAYDVLWRKLRCETDLPDEVTELFRFWYQNQTNTVRWVGAYSDKYRLKCGVRQDRMNKLHEIGRMSNQHGGLVAVWLSNRLYISVTDPEALAVVSRACLDKDEFTIKFMRTAVGNGSIFAPVNIWHPRRKTNAPFFNLKNLHTIVPVFDKQSSIMVDLLKAEVGRDFSIWKNVTTFTFDAVGETAMGITINSQGNSGHVLLQAIDQSLHMLAERILQPWLYPNFVYKSLPVYKLFQEQIQRCYNFIDEIILNKREEIKRKNSNNDTVWSNFLDTIIQSSGGKQGYSDTELREEIFVMLVAGTDTSATAVCFTAVLLSRYPEVQEKVHQELQEVFGDSDRSVTVEDLQKLKYLEAVIKESMRLYPPVPVVTREIHNDLVLPSGATLVDGTAILVNIWGTHRNPAYWGEDAEQFRPERFLDSALQHPAMFIPFSYSVRNCIGGTYAMLSAKTAVANLLRRYRLLPPTCVRAADLKRPLPVKYDIMMKAVDGFLVRIEEKR